MENGNKAIFPIGQGLGSERGLTKREYFAAMAMQGMLAGIFTTNDCNMTVESVAEWAIKHSDELLKKLK